MIGKKYLEILDKYGISYREGNKHDVEKSIKQMDAIFEEVFLADRKTEPLDKDINVRSKDEPQIEREDE